MRLAARDEREGAAGGSHACGASDAVDVNFGIFGDVVIDDVGDLVDVDAAGGEIGGDKDVDFAGFEAAHDALAFVLHEVAVDGAGGDAVALESCGDFIHAAFGAAENDGECGLFGSHQHLDCALFVPRFDADVKLRGVGRRELFIFCGGEDAGGVDHVPGDHALDVIADGRGDEEGLVLNAAEGEDFADVVAESDVEHAIDFIADDKFHVVEDEGTAFLEVHDAAGGADDDVGLMFKLFELAGDFGATVGEGEAYGFVLGEAAHFGFDLDGKLAGGNDDEGLERLGEIEFLEDGEAEGGGLAGAGAGLPEDIDAGEGDGDHFFLDFGGGDEMDLGEGVEDGGFEAELLEGGGKFDFYVWFMMFVLLHLFVEFVLIIGGCGWGHGHFGPGIVAVLKVVVCGMRLRLLGKMSGRLRARRVRDFARRADVAEDRRSAGRVAFPGAGGLPVGMKRRGDLMAHVEDRS